MIIRNGIPCDLSKMTAGHVNILNVAVGSADDGGHVYGIAVDIRKIEVTNTSAAVTVTDMDEERLKEIAVDIDV